jgi:hypothetical protein
MRAKHQGLAKAKSPRSAETIAEPATAGEVVMSGGGKRTGRAVESSAACIDFTSKTSITKDLTSIIVLTTRE